jgi:hypothetical protein
MVDQLPTVDSDRGPTEALPVILVGLDGTPYSSGSVAIGNSTDPAWNGTDPSASLISIMKACYARLTEIAANTGA